VIWKKITRKKITRKKITRKKPIGSLRMWG
jgi:hypothetical protein